MVERGSEEPDDLVRYEEEAPAPMMEMRITQPFGLSQAGRVNTVQSVPWIILRSVLTSDDFAKVTDTLSLNNSSGRNCALSQNVGSNPT